MQEERVSAPEESSGDPNLKSGVPESGEGVSGGGARYKLMSPAKLPISRSACITIPPGLSPTSFLESPVLLSDAKVEPSPTTGSLIKHQSARSSLSSISHPTTLCSKSFPERESSDFEFRVPSKLNMTTADINCQSSEQLVQGQSEGQSCTLSSSAKTELAASSIEVSCSAPQTIAASANASAEVDTDELAQSENQELGASQSDAKGSTGSILVEDGYNWRKYGQKHVKGSEFPRSYYKCTYPNCEVKKIFERAHDGQIIEIVYKGIHHHPKPQPSRRYCGGVPISTQEERLERVSSQIAPDDKTYGMCGPMAHSSEANGNSKVSPSSVNDDSGDVAASSGINNDLDDDDDPFLKRRKMDGSFEVTPVVKPIREPRVVVQTVSEVDILDDGYRWRKYGQKVVRGNPNPRSYYKCTSAGCPVRKHVERASHDPKAVITTYEGKHNHEVPTAKTSSHDVVPGNGGSRFRPEHNPISLDLGVGLNSGADSRSDEPHHLNSDFAAPHPPLPSFRFVHAASIAAFYSIPNGGMNQYHARESPSEPLNGDISLVNYSSHQYPESIRRTLAGP